MKKKQIRNLAIALSLTAALGTGATLALLTAQTGTVENTFTVGKNLRPSDLLLNEYDYNDDNRTANKDVERVTELHFENLMQGDVMDKDPTVQINPEAAECYMFVHITGLDDLEGKGITVDWSDKWIKADGTDTNDGYYYYAGTGTTKNVLNPGSDALKDEKGINKNDGKGFKDLDALFTTVTVGKNAKIYKEDGTQEALANIVVKACAVQAQNVGLDDNGNRNEDTVEAAFEKLPEGF